MKILSVEAELFCEEEETEGRTGADRPTDRQTDMTKLFLCCFAKAPEKQRISVPERCYSVRAVACH